MPCWHLERTEGSPGCYLVSSLCPWIFLQYVWPRCSWRTLYTRWDKTRSSLAAQKYFLFFFLHDTEDSNAFFFKAITAREGQRLQSQRMVSLEISVLEDISALQAQQRLLPAPVENTVMQQVRNLISAASVWLGKARCGLYLLSMSNNVSIAADCYELLSVLLGTEKGFSFFCFLLIFFLLGWFCFHTFFVCFCLFFPDVTWWGERDSFTPAAGQIVGLQLWQCTES